MKIRTNPLDTLCSEYIRRRAINLTGGCERCLAPKHDIEKEDGAIFPAWKQLDWAHFHGRGEKSIRWDEENSCGLCGGCHMYLDSHPLDKVEFFLKRLGQEAFDLLNARRRVRGKPDRAALTIYFKQKIKELEVKDAN